MYDVISLVDRVDGFMDNAQALLHVTAAHVLLLSASHYARYTDSLMLMTLQVNAPKW